MLYILICLLRTLYIVDGHAAAVNVDIPSFQAQPTSGDKIALLVGVRKYHPNSGIRALQYADKDMQRLQKVLEQHGYKVELLVNENATRGEILSALRFMPNRLKDPANSTVIFAFSGHGLALKEQNYLVTYDTYAKDPELLDIPDNALLLSQVMQLIRETGAKQQLMWLDACRNNLLENGKDIGIGTNGGMRAVSSEDAQGLMILFSSEQGMRSYEDNKLEAGIFSHFLIQGLTGANGQTLDADGWIRMDKLRIYVENQVSTYALETRRVQVPYIGGEFHGQFWVGQVAPPGLEAVRDNPVEIAEPPPVAIPERQSFESETLAVPAGEFISNRYQDNGDVKVKPSFDCNRAKRYSSIIVCGSNELARLDLRLSTVFNQAMSTVRDTIELKRQEQYWIGNVMYACQTYDCVRNAYIDRIKVIVHPLP